MALLFRLDRSHLRLRSGFMNNSFIYMSLGKTSVRGVGEGRRGGGREKGGRKGFNDIYTMLIMCKATLSLGLPPAPFMN